MIRELDIEVDDDGDLVIGADGDISLATAIRTAKQDIIFRVRTQAQDFLLHPLIGANLSAFLGEPNNNRTAEKIKGAVFRALARDGRFRDSSIQIDVVPVAPTEIALLIGIVDTVEGSTNNVIVSAFSFNYHEGTISVMR